MSSLRRAIELSLREHIRREERAEIDRVDTHSYRQRPRKRKREQSADKQSISSNEARRRRAVAEDPVPSTPENLRRKKECDRVQSLRKELYILDKKLRALRSERSTVLARFVIDGVRWSLTSSYVRLSDVMSSKALHPVVAPLTISRVEDDDGDDKNSVALRDEKEYPAVSIPPELELGAYESFASVYRGFRAWAKVHLRSNGGGTNSIAMPSKNVRWETHTIFLGSESERRQLSESRLGNFLDRMWSRCFRKPLGRRRHWGDPQRFPLGSLNQVVCLVAREDGHKDSNDKPAVIRRIIGMASLEKRLRDPFRGDVFVHDVCILPLWRRSSGIPALRNASRVLMRAACVAAARVAWPNGRIKLEVDARGSSRLISFYESCGFTSRRPPSLRSRSTLARFIDRRAEVGNAFWRIENETTPRMKHEEYKGMAPVLVGTLLWSRDRGTCVWTGQWAESDFALAEGRASDFAYESPLVHRCTLCGSDFATADSLRIHNIACSTHVASQRRKFRCDRPVSGFYSGHFLVRQSETANARVVRERNVRLEFEDTGSESIPVRGSGRNEFGAFLLSGSWNASTSHLEARRFYMSEDMSAIDAAKRRRHRRRSAERERERRHNFPSTFWTANGERNRRRYAELRLFHSSKTFAERDVSEASASRIRLRLRRTRHFVDNAGKRYIVMHPRSSSPAASLEKL